MGDSGTASRVFATFLTWMQEKTAPVFVFATANNVRRLPPELLRKGRFDEVFFLDFPTLMPVWMYKLGGTIGWKMPARKYGTQKLLKARPYQKVME